MLSRSSFPFPSGFPTKFCTLFSSLIHYVVARHLPWLTEVNNKRN
jgi:hypothetical protein